MSAVTHIAGMAVLLGRHGVQRCAWCGEMLFEVTGDEMSASNSDGSPPDPIRPWPEGCLLEVTKSGACTGYVVVGNGKENEEDDLPPNSCAGPPKLRAIEGGKRG